MKKDSYKKTKETGEIPPEVQQVMDRFNMLYKAWYAKQESDFEDNKESVKSHMVERRKIVPPNFKRFWKWYLQYCGENDFDLSREIEPPDFVLYDEWEREQMYQSLKPKKTKSYSHRAAVIAIALAVKDGKIEEEFLAYSQKKFITLVCSKFRKEMEQAGIKHPEKNESVYREKRRFIRDHNGYKGGLDWAKKYKTDDYKLGEKLSETHFHTSILDQD